MKKFKKRIYKNIAEFFNDLKYMSKNLKKIKLIQQGEIINDNFRQRLMMVVTVVNDCRYCTYYHSRMALESGITSDELDSLLSGTVENSPVEEKIALLYAQHWADNNGNPDTDFNNKLIETYGREKAEIINITLRIIRFGNLAGNTLDFFLYKITFGLLGNN